MDPLFNSVQLGDLKGLIELLARYPSGVNALDENGQSVLHYACALGHLPILNHMLSLPNCEFFQKDRIYGYTCLHIACLYDQQRVVNELLRRFGDRSAPINAQDNLGWTALHHAARNGNLEICRKLISSSARPDLANVLGKTPCHYAAEYGHVSVLKYMFDYVQDQLTPPVILQKVLTVPTLLHCAALNNHASVLDWLRHTEKPYPPVTKCKRVLNFIDNSGRDELPEDVAGVRGHKALRTSLISYKKEYERWIQDIREDKISLDRIKFCICGNSRVGKSALRQSLSRPYIQKWFGKDVQPTNDADMDRCTFGIEVTSLQLSGRDLFSVWDFAGQIESFITHHFFISTQSTVFAVLVDLTSSLDDQRAQLLRWLGFIKVRNLGQVPFLKGLRDIEKDIVPMPSLKRDFPRQLPVRSWIRGSLRGRVRTDEDSITQETMYGTVLQPVPVMIVGSHYDQISSPDALDNTQKLVTEMKERFEEYLKISDQLYPLNCLRAVSPEICRFKEHLCETRSTLIDLQPKYPRVVELVARKIESLDTSQKILDWEEIRRLVREEINGLVSERQLGFICKLLADAGVLVYFQDGALTRHVFVDPGWLCHDVLGKALAPDSFPVSRIASIGSSRILIDVLQQKFANHIDQQYIPIIIELLQEFDLCHPLKDDPNTLQFPALLKESISSTQNWITRPGFIYSGRRLVCADETDSLPPGFFCRLQVQVSNIFKQEEVILYKDSFLVTNGGRFEALVQINEHNTEMDLIGRTEQEFVTACSQLLDQIQGVLSKLIRVACPTIFLQLYTLSAADLQAHSDEPYCYKISDVIAAEGTGGQVMNQVSKCQESAKDLLFFGDDALQKQNCGKLTKITHMPEEVICKVQDLLQNGEEDWRSLAQSLNLGQYIQLLESKTPESTRLLLLKWGEKPKWNVQSLLYALKDINRMDVYNYVQARLTLS